MKRFRSFLDSALLFAVFVSFVLSLSGASAKADSPQVSVMSFDGPITPALTQYIDRAIKVADQQGAELLILQLNTPGGSIDTLTDIVQAIRASDVPVVVYVAPRGAMAGSAGAVITLAGHASAMAPETTIGAASPVGAQGEDLGQTLQAKVGEIIKAQIRTLTERRGAEAVNLAENMVDNAKAVSSDEALQAGLIDFIANDINDLVRQLDGFTVKMPDGERTLHTAGAIITDLPMSLIEQLLQILINPNIVFLLITIGVQAILIELSNPGGWVAGFIGACCLALAGYGLGVLPVNWFGMIFLILAFILFILDVKAPTHGALTAAGIGSLIVGALMLFNTPFVTPEYLRVSVPLVLIVSVATGLLFGVIVAFGVRAQRAPVQTGQEALVGKIGTARTDLDPRGQVQVTSELWSAELIDGSKPVHAGEKILVISAEGVRLKVRGMD
jgi:membrane-bound serine protease (ClpP class)